ncbi:MAG: hypothetical protein OJF51_003596 [Nitrospira sp.]|nr:MAG: hypothetical protein OJF51_003596 [Nitrospira sp.]
MCEYREERFWRAETVCEPPGRYKSKDTWENDHRDRHTDCYPIRLSL